MQGTKLYPLTRASRDSFPSTVPTICQFSYHMPSLHQPQPIKNVAYLYIGQRLPTCATDAAILVLVPLP